MRKDEKGRAIFAAFRRSFQALQGDMSLEKFAKKMAMPQSLVRAYLNGTRFPDAAGLQKISALGGVSVDWLLGRSSVRPREHVRVTAQEMGLSADAAAQLQSICGDGGEEDNVPMQLINAMIESENFGKFIQQVTVYRSRVEQVKRKMQGADPSMLDFYAYRLRAEKLAVTEVLGELVNDMVPLPSFQKEEKA